MLFFFLRSILSKQKCEADVLLERRQIKRGIKKYFKKSGVISDYLRNSVVSEIIAGNHQENEIRETGFIPDMFSRLFDSKQVDSSDKDSKLNKTEATIHENKSEI